MAKERNEQICVTMKESIYKYFLDIALKENRPLSQTVAMFLEKHLKVK